MNAIAIAIAHGQSFNVVLFRCMASWRVQVIGEDCAAVFLSEKEAFQDFAALAETGSSFEFV